MLLLLHRIGNLLAYVRALLVASFLGFQASVPELLVRETQIRQVANFLLLPVFAKLRVFAKLTLISTFSNVT